MAPVLKQQTVPFDSTLWREIRNFLTDKDDRFFADADADADSSIRADDTAAWEDVSENDEDDDAVAEKQALSYSKSIQRSQRTIIALHWLQHALVATIPTFEQFAFAFGHRLIVVGLSNAGDRWRKLFSSNFTDFELRSLLCLPIAPARVSDPRPYDWTAILVGTSDGQLIAFSDNGDRLFTHRFGNLSIVDLRLQADQLFVVSADKFAIIDGSNLLTVLKIARQRLRNPVFASSDRSTSVANTELTYDYWRLNDVQKPKAIIATGPRRVKLLDGLNKLSLKGFKSYVNPSQPSYETYCATNGNNFLSFNWYGDDGQAAVLMETIQNLTNRLKIPSFVSSWWGGSKASTSATSSGTADSKEFHEMHPIRNVKQRSCLPDKQRFGERLVPAPGARFLAVCDNLGRVSLVDTSSRLLVRMWKGYRDAECAWLELSCRFDDQDSNKFRQVLCLVIFAPRRGILETWTTQNGFRAAAFNVDKRGKLLYCPMPSLIRCRSSEMMLPTRFLDSNGKFYTVEMSADAALERPTFSTFWTASAKEEFAKEWRNVLIDETQLGATIAALWRLSNVSDATYLLDIVVSSSKIDHKMFIKLVDNFGDYLTNEKKEGAVAEAKTLSARLLAYKQVTHFFAMVVKYIDENDENDWKFDDPIDVHRLLGLESPEELNKLLVDLDDNMRARAEVRGRESGEESQDYSKWFPKFLNSIDQRSILRNLVVADDTVRISLKKDIDERLLAQLGDFVFKPFVTRVPATELGRNVKPLLGLETRDWSRLFCAYWLRKNRRYSVHPARLYQLFQTLSFLKSNGNAILHEIKRTIVESSNLAEALCLCSVVMSSVNADTSDRNPDDSDWQKVETKVEDWDSLKRILHGLLLVETASLRIYKQSGVKGALEPMSTRRLLTTGSDYISECLAKAFAAGNPTSAVACYFSGLDGWNRLQRDSSTTASKPVPFAALEKAMEYYPLSLKLERLLTALLWEFVRRWHQAPARVELLSAVSELLQAMQNDRLRHNFSVLAWRTFCIDYYKKFCDLLTKTKGKDCTEALSHEAGLPTTSVLEFARFVHFLFTVMLESVERLEGAGQLSEDEDFLENFFQVFRREHSEATNRECLWRLVARQPATSRQRVELHWQLSATVFMTAATHFALKLAPMNLFSWDDRSVMFKSLSEDEDQISRLSEEDSEQQQLDSGRSVFLLSYVTASVRSLPSRLYTVAMTETQSQLPDFSLAVKLARCWNMNFDSVRRQEIVELYLAGYPDLAARLLPLVEDRRQLATLLLDMVGRTLCSRWTTQVSNRSKMSTSLWNWLLQKQSPIKAAPLSIDACRSALDFVARTLSADNQSQPISEELLETIGKLETDT